MILIIITHTCNNNRNTSNSNILGAGTPDSDESIIHHAHGARLK